MEEFRGVEAFTAADANEQLSSFADFVADVASKYESAQESDLESLETE